MQRHTIDDDTLREVARQHGTPCWVYDAGRIRERVAQLQRFGVVRYAQKANSNVHVLKLMRSLGVVVDAVSLGELERALAAGYDGTGEPSGIVYCSDILDRTALRRVAELKIPVNVGSPQMLPQLAEASPGHRVWLRINPGFGSGFNRKTNTGGEFSKHGIWHENVQGCYDMIRRHELRLQGLHMHIGSGADVVHLQRVCDAMINEVKKCPIDIHAVSAGGGLPATYRDGEQELDMAAFHEIWSAAREKIEAHLGHPVSLEIEPGRYVVANSGCLVSEVRAKKDVGPNRFVLVDAGFNDLMRPAMYGSFHQIEIVEQAGAPRRGNVRPTIVGGPLCEAGDLFTQEAGGGIVAQDMADPEVGDLAVFNDAGAYCASMSSNYNSRTLAPEVLLDGGSHRLIRRRQTMDELLALELSCG